MFYDTIELLFDGKTRPVKGYVFELFRDLSYKTQEHTNLKVPRRLVGAGPLPFFLTQVKVEVLPGPGMAHVEWLDQLTKAARVYVGINYGTHAYAARLQSGMFEAAPRKVTADDDVRAGVVFDDDFLPEGTYGHILVKVTLL